MNRLFSIIILLLSSVAVMASPVRRGQWKTVKTTDGREVRVEAKGDEHFHYWQSADGTCYVPDTVFGVYREADASAMRSEARSKRMSRTKKRVARVPGKQLTDPTDSAFYGKKRGLIILVQFSGKEFSMTNPKTVYTRIANEKNYSENGFHGSVRDYFLAQSNGNLDLEFDVAGPVTLSQPYSYYGRNEDAKVGEMIHDACVAVDGEVNFSQYDWNNDGVAEEVFVLFAGYGQADHSSNDNYIWPHMHSLSGYDYYKDTTLTLDNTVIDVYACANELNADDALDGIGTFCHEFSHCMGLPDMYDTNESGNYGMGSWDLMDYGCYNGNGRVPAGYTGYEKMACGWSKPIVLSTDTVVAGMKAMNDHGQTFVVFNEAHPDEYYVLENRQQKGFDAELPGHGMLITHIDYDQKLWDYNLVNGTGYNQEANMSNTHQRATIFPADNDAGNDSEAGDAYPYRGNDRLTPTSLPAAMLYNAAADGRKLMNHAITDIRENGDGTVSFAFKAGTADVPDTPSEGETQGNVLLKETFDKCSGTGGNDGAFSGNVAGAAFMPDLEGWSAAGPAYGGMKCARFGKSSGGAGSVTSPTFVMKGDTVTLSFKAAAWNATKDGTALLVTLNGSDCKFVEGDSREMALDMKRGEWTSYVMKMTGKGNVSISFAPSRRFFLDEVSVVVPVATGITGVRTDRRNVSVMPRIYSVDGRYMGTDADRLPRGIYIVNGKKIVR